MELNRFTGSREKLEEAGMAGKIEKSEEKPIATAFENVSVSATSSGAKAATVTGQLIRTDNKEGIGGATVSITISASSLATATAEGVSPQNTAPAKTFTATSDSTGAFKQTVDMADLPAGAYDVEFKFTGDTDDSLAPASTTKKHLLNSQSAGGAQVPSAKPCIPCSDPIATVNRVMRDRTVTAAVSELLLGAAEDVRTNKFPSVKNALQRMGSAIAGTDAVAAEGEPCQGQFRLEMYLYDTLNEKQELLRQELSQAIDIQLIDLNNNLAAYDRSHDDRGILFSQVEASEIVVAFPSEIVKGVEISRYYEVLCPEETHFISYSRSSIQTNHPGSDNGYSSTVPDPNVTATTPKKLQALDQGDFLERRSQNLANPTPRSGFRARIVAGRETIMRCFLNPPVAQVRCFSWLDGEGGGCLQGKQYISRVAISVWRGDNRITCNATGDSGGTGFELNPGWYTFCAPEEVTIEGCNYKLASSSPVSAFLGAGQGCSDIFFRYTKKGNEIEVISQVIYPDADNPYVQAKDNFAGMTYLLLSENNPAFVPQQETSADGSPVFFQNLDAGAYLLFCQAPPTVKSQPVQPVYPKGGRLTLTVFGGQTSPVPLLVKFRTSTTTPAILDGYVRDDYGSPMPGQLVKIVNNAGCIVAAGLTDSTGYYSIQLYSAENVAIVVGAAQIAVSKTQIQAAMQTVGTPALASPRTSMERALQDSDLIAAFRE
jgi:hypothetical protein